MFGYYIYLQNNEMYNLPLDVPEESKPVSPFPKIQVIYHQNSIKESREVYQKFQYFVNQYFLKYQFFLFSQESLKKDVKMQENFYISKIDVDLNLKEVYFKKFNRLEEESFEFLAILREIMKNQCKNPEEFFLYLRGDYNICKKAFPHLLTVYHWASLYKDNWSVIRMGKDSSGLLLQCKDISKLIEIIEQGIIKNGKPFTYQMAHNWEKFENRTDFTYRYKLFTNSIEKDECLSWNLYPSKYSNEHFKLSCDGKVMSPCNSEVIDILKFRTFPEIDIPLDYHHREVLLKRVNFEIVANENLFRPTCLEACEDRNMECIDHSPLWLNNCELMRKKFNTDCRCYNMVNDESPELPLWDLIHRECHLLTNMSLFDCSSKRFGASRLCLCHKLSQEDQLSFVKKSQKVIQEFNKIMRNYHAKNEIKVHEGYSLKKRV